MTRLDAVSPTVKQAPGVSKPTVDWSKGQGALPLEYRYIKQRPKRRGRAVADLPDGARGGPGGQPAARSAEETPSDPRPVAEVSEPGLRGRGARLGGTVSLDPEDAEYALEYRLEMTLDGADPGARLRVAGIALPVRSWRELAGGVAVTFEDEIEMSDGREVVSRGGLADVVLDGTRLPAKANELRVLRDAGGSGLTVRVVGEVTSRDANATSWPLDVTSAMEVGAVTVFPDPDDGPGDARDIAARFLDLADYDAAERDGSLVLTPVAT